MSSATASIRLYPLDKHQFDSRSGYRSRISLGNTCISWSSTAKYGYGDSVRQYVHSLDIDDQHRTGRMKRHAAKDPHPEPPASPKASSFVGWLYGVILTTFTMIIPLWTAGKWGPLPVFKKKMDSVMEIVEDVTEVIEDVAEMVDEITDKVSEHLPEESRLKYILDKIDDAAEKTIEATDFAQEILEKVEDIEDIKETILKKLINNDLTHDKKVNDVEMKMERAVEKLIDKDRKQDKKVVDVEKNMERVVEKLIDKVQAHEDKIANIEKRMEMIGELLIKRGHERNNKTKLSNLKKYIYF